MSSDLDPLETIRQKNPWACANYDRSKTPVVSSRTYKYWYVLPNTFTPDTYYDKVKEKWVNLHKGSIAVRDETPIKKNYLKGWVVCEDGIERYCLAPIPGSYTWKGLTETPEVIK